MTTASDYHTLPVDDLVPHDKVRFCWCQPAIKMVCDECDGEGCWQCVNGLVVVPADTVGSVLVIHNAADGRE